MTKRELLAALEAFGDNQEVFVCLFSRDEPNVPQVIIRGVASIALTLTRDELAGLLYDADRQMERRVTLEVKSDGTWTS